MRLIFLFILVVSTTSVNAQIDELKRAHDKGKEYVNVSGNRGNTYFSKTPYVNPFIGTGGHGHTYPGASAPFGMIQLSPDTRHTGWDGCSGYHYSDSIIYGFSHTHLSGTGVSDYGDLLIVPQNGKPRIDPGYESPKGYGAHFSHDNESAAPGFYQVHLDDGDIDVRLTVSQRAGFHEYTFNNKSGKKFILIDLDHRDKVLSTTLNTLDKNTIVGSRTSEAWASKQHFFFHLVTDVPYQKARFFMKDGRNKLLLIFPKSTKQVNIRVGISAVDTKGARANLESEIPDWNFDKTRANVTRHWNSELDKIHFETKDKEVMTNFYTGLYHSYLAPNIFSDIDGRYRGRDHQVHQLQQEDDNQYTVFSLWDTYRATHPLFTLTQVERTNDFVRTFLRQFEEGGDLPVWELAGNETECMIGYHSVSVIADAFVKGIKDYDVNAAIKAMVMTSKFDEFGKKEFNENGYINAGNEPESVSKALEYSYDIFCIGAMMNALQESKGNGVSALGTTTFDKNQFNFVNHFDPSTGFMRARRDGLWFAPFDAGEVNFNYTEANSWQYSLYAPHAVGVLRDLLGGSDSLEAWLDRLFTTEMELSGRDQADITGLIGQYAHGNEPSHHMAYLYNYTNSPEKTQHYIDRILNEMYSNAPDGLSGNEDCGQMSSWYVLSALGIYQIAPGNPYYEIGRPLMNEAIIHFENGKSLAITVKNNGADKKYVRQVTLNGVLLNRNYISHDELIGGGDLEIVMGRQAKEKNDQYSHAPTLSELPKTFVPLPYFNETERIFTDSLQLSLSTINQDQYSIHYTTDGSEPTSQSKQYEHPFTIHDKTVVKAIAVNQSGKSSVITNTFIQTDNTVSLNLESEYANQYASTGPLALIDGIKGGHEFRTGDWQGYWAQDVVAEIVFDEPRSISEVGIGVLSDMKSWVFLPRSISVAFSYDGEKIESGTTQIFESQGKNDMYPHKKDVNVKIDAEKPVKKIRIIVNNLGKCPDWHLGAGNDTWLFLDEITFK